jgi:excisionase family DNA binding protein
MAALIEQKEAARLLGISEDELAQLISRNEIFGYRDGPGWKFKMTELERVAEERGVRLGSEPIAPGGSGIDADLMELQPVPADDDEAESILVSEEELGQSANESTASTIIGREITSAPPSEDSDIEIAADDVSGDALAMSDVALVGPGSDTGLKLDDDLSGASDSLALDEGDSISLGGSDALSLGSGGSDSLSLDDDYDDEAPTQLGKAAPRAEDEDDLLSSDSIGLSGSNLLSGAGGSGSAGGSALDLSDDDGEDLVLGSGSGPGSDVTLGAGDSGIGLATPTDSGLSLEEEPIELGGSQVGSMALGEDDMIELDEDADPEAATQLKADDDFLLTPVDDDAEEESDSGSQVIALDTEQFDDTANTMLAAGPAVLEEDEFAAMPAGGMAMGPGMMAGPGMMGQPMMQPVAQLPEAKYSVWNVLSLMVVMLLMVVAGLMMVDLVRNMWQWDESLSVNRSLMEFMTSFVEK